MRKLFDSMNLAADCLLAWLNPDMEYMPTGGFEVAHDTGRWWDAMLRWENVLGMEIPPWAEEAMYRNIRRLMDNDAGFLANRPDIPWMKEKSVFNPHNIREGMLALTALIKYRGDEWAVAKTHQMLRTLDSFQRTDGSFDYAGIGRLIGLPVREIHSSNTLDGTSMEGRALEPIIEYYLLTGDMLALELAESIAKRQFSISTSENGSIPERIISPDNIGHNHSYLGTLRGLLKYGIMTDDKSFITRISETYDNSIFVNNVSYAGWAPHDLGKRRFNNEDGDPEGDPASCGDAMQIALWLAMETGRTRLLDDVERLAKARILPQQITGDPDPGRNGAWGIYRHPFGFGAILDVFAAVLHTLCDVYENIVTIGKEGTVDISMAFDIDSPDAGVRITDDDCRVIEISPFQKEDHRIRIPEWVSPKSIRVMSNGNNIEDYLLEGGYVYIKGKYIEADSVIEVHHELPVRTTTETMKVSGREFRLLWKGDEIISSDPPVPMYP